MKFISDYKELEGQVFNSINECKEAENKVNKEREVLAEKEKNKSKLKKKLSQEVEAAENALKEAYAEYEKAKAEAARILDESNKQALEVINTAKDRVKKAEQAKTDAIVKFNTECGPYQKVYTGDAAKAELDRVEKQFTNIFDNIFNWLF